MHTKMLPAKEKSYDVSAHQLQCLFCGKGGYTGNCDSLAPPLKSGQKAIQNEKLRILQHFLSVRPC